MDLRLDDFMHALTSIKPFIKKTSLMRCKPLEEILKTSCRIFLKLENEQPTHSFKVRGAFNALLNLSEKDKVNGVVTRSSGNFAQAIAYAGNQLNIRTQIVMPTNAPEVKKLSTQRFDVELTFAGTTHEEGGVAVEKISLATGATIISPYNHMDVIKGQGTIAIEVVDELPSVRHFVCPIGGGGLLSGCSAAFKLFNPEIEIIGIEPEGAADYYLSRLHGKIVSLDSIQTICDGLRASQVGTLNRPLLDRYVDRVFTISDLSVMKAMKFLRDYCGLIIEPSGAAALAGLMHHKPPFQGDVVCVISGSNVDASTFEKCMQQI